MEQEFSELICKGCLLLKKRFLDGNYPNKKDRRWVDENGRQWSGNYCSICHAENVAKRKRDKKTK